MNIEDIKADDTLVDFMRELLGAGFQIFVYDGQASKKVTYFKIVKDNQIGYVQKGHFGGFDFSTVHKPNRDTGTGFSMAQEVSDPTIEMAEKCFSLAPYWATTSQRESVIKYKNWDEYTSKSGMKYIEIVK